MRIHLNMTDNELIQRIQNQISNAKHLIDVEDVEELLKRFKQLQNDNYQYETIMDEQGIGYDAIK